jgi:hypothetical protein
MLNTVRIFLFGENIIPENIIPENIIPENIIPENIINYEREMRGDFQSPRLNFTCFTPIVTDTNEVNTNELNTNELNTNEQPNIMWLKVNNIHAGHTNISHKHVTNTKVKLTISTTNQTIYQESILIDEYDDNINYK